MCECIQINLENIFIVPVCEAAEAAMVGVCEGIDDFLSFCLGFGFGLFRCVLTTFCSLLFGGIVLAQLFLEIFKSQALLPKLLRLVQILGIRLLFAIEGNLVIRVESELFVLEQVINVGDTLLKALNEAVKDFAGWPCICSTALTNG